ncbi:MAG: 3'(2'),5'-bisphosphate nucleotidase CysQ [Endozoicomonas sp.]
MLDQSLESLFPHLEVIAKEAGRAILDIYEQDDLGIETKQDSSPVTQADLAANTVIEKGLRALPVQYPILSEESEHSPWPERRNWHRYWLVDPLDGTREFINRNGQFSVNIALIEGNYPLLGVVHVPVSETSYWGGRDLGACKKVPDQPAHEIHPRPFQPEREVLVLGSRSYGTGRAKAYLDVLKGFYPNLQTQKVGSSLKSCYIAEGLADFYPRLGPTSEWDTGAVQALVEGAGGVFLDSEGQRFSYNRKESLINPDFLVLGDPVVDWSAFWNQEALNP